MKNPEAKPYDRAAVIREASILGESDANARKEPLWYPVGASYVCASTGRVGPSDVAYEYCAAYLRHLGDAK